MQSANVIQFDDSKNCSLWESKLKTFCDKNKLRINRELLEPLRVLDGSGNVRLEDKVKQEYKSWSQWTECVLAYLLNSKIGAKNIVPSEFVAGVKRFVKQHQGSLPENEAELYRFLIEDNKALYEKRHDGLKKSSENMIAKLAEKESRIYQLRKKNEIRSARLQRIELQCKDAKKGLQAAQKELSDTKRECEDILVSAKKKYDDKANALSLNYEALQKAQEEQMQLIKKTSQAKYEALESEKNEEIARVKGELGDLADSLRSEYAGQLSAAIEKSEHYKLVIQSYQEPNTLIQERNKAYRLAKKAYRMFKAEQEAFNGFKSSLALGAAVSSVLGLAVILFSALK